MRSLLLGFPLFLAMSSTTRAGNFITVDYPDPTVTNTQLFGINSAGQAVGNYVDAENAVHGFSYDSISGKFTPIDFPDALFTSCGNISENGDIVGRVITSDNISHGYLLRGGVFTLFDAPDPQTTGSVTFGINPSGDSIVGDYCLSGDCLGAVTNHGFLLSNVTLTNNGLEGNLCPLISLKLGRQAHLELTIPGRSSGAITAARIIRSMDICSAIKF